ncbi:hypothetical protein Bca101_028939 [Brassica carinata]
MKHLVLFILVTTYCRLHEACEKNLVILHNELGPGRLLQFHCVSNDDDLGTQTLAFNASPYIISFHDELLRVTRWTCLLRQGANMEYFYQIQAYKAGDRFIPKCGQIRVWTAKLDGDILFQETLIPRYRE